MGVLEPLWIGHYFGIPYKEWGRGIDGIDSYGLYRLIRAEQFGEAVPSFQDVASSKDLARIIGKNLENYPSLVIIPDDKDCFLFGHALDAKRMLTIEPMGVSCILDYHDFDVYLNTGEDLYGTY